MSTTIALSVGFGVLTLSNFVPIMHFGFLSAMVIMFALVGDLFVTPVVLSFTQLISLWDMIELRLKTEVLTKSKLFENMRGWEIKKVILLGKMSELEQNEYADEIIITKYEEIGNYITEGELSYIMIVTPMHAGDKDTLKSVIHKNVKYIGLMGSKRKIKSIFDTLSEDGVDEKLFDRVHTPIGLEIEAESPEEIAISIAAEVIKVKNSTLIEQIETDQ